MIDPFRQIPLGARVNRTVGALVLVLCLCVVAFALRQAGWT